jgi:sigma-B regulation protein RsbU (phosphoserine phosphatase)
MLLPATTPRLTGLDVAAQYVPTPKVGGDFYDFCVLSPARLGIAATDVSVQGSPASLLMAICRTNLPLISRRDPASGQPVSEFIGSAGMPVGLVKGETFDGAIADQTVSFRPGDTLVLYTDGITEAANEKHQEFSGSRLAGAVRTLGGCGAAEFNDGILDLVRRFSGRDHHRDDLTLVAVRRT